MLVGQLMRRQVVAVAPNTSIRAAAALMKERNVGVLPVCEDERPVGIVTDRDIVTRWVLTAETDSAVSTIMSPRVHSCRAEQSIEEIARYMGDCQIRRLLVLDGDGRMIGIVTLGDIANDASEELAGQALGEIVELR